jgi:hypothetical protein
MICNDEGAGISVTVFVFEMVNSGLHEVNP